MPSQIAESRSGVSSIFLNSTASLLCAVIVGFSALVAVPIPGTPVPATLQTFALLTCAGMLGRWYAVQMVAWYFALGLAGAPFFTGGGGSAPLFGATGGYIVGFFAATAITGFFSSGFKNPVYKTALYVAAALALYVPGVAWLKVATSSDWSASIAMGFLPFVAADVVKAVAASAIACRFNR